MRRWTLLLAACLASVPAPASAAEGVPAEEIAASSVAATVLDHRIEVRIDGSRSARTSQTWTVRVDAPERLTDGILAPPGLEGASDGDARVRDGRLAFPRGTAPGTVFTLRSEGTDWGGPFSGALSTAPGLPTARAEVRVRATGGAPVAVWSDDRAAEDRSSHGGRSVELIWEDLPAGAPGQVVWTTWSDWLEPGRRIDRAVDRLLTDYRGLGRDLGADLTSLSAPTAWDRVRRSIRLDPSGGTWADARPVLRVVKEGRGTAAERGAVLINLLREAGWDARPALVRPVGTVGPAPLSVPAPAMLPRPVVVVLTEQGRIWIDPAADHVAVPETPASIRGGIAWIAGDLPMQVGARGLTDGVVTVSGEVVLAPDGGATFNLTLIASGIAQELLRERLAPIGQTERSQLFLDLVEQGHPRVDRFTSTTSGAEDPSRPLRVTLQGHEPAVLKKTESGYEGDLVPMVAPALAAWLPPRILVREELSMKIPGGRQPVATLRPVEAFHPDVTLSRALRPQGNRVTLTTEVERPGESGGGGLSGSAAAFLRERATLGLRVLLYESPTPALAKAIREGDRPLAERRALEAVVLVRAEKGKKAGKRLQQAVPEVGLDALIPELERLLPPGEDGPWRALYEASPDPGHRLAIVHAMERTGNPDAAWLHAALVARETTGALRRRALIRMARSIGAQPQRGDEPDALLRWRPRAEILAELEAEAAQDDPELLVLLAEHALSEDRNADAEAWLERALARERGPVALVLLADAAARAGVASEDVERRIEEAVGLAPSDPRVMGHAADVLARIGARERAVHYALAAARLQSTDPSAWSRASNASLAVGDLPTAVAAARRASDLAPEDAQLGRLLQRLATLAVDRDGADLGAKRGGEGGGTTRWPPALDDLLKIAGTDALLALLDHHDAQVVGQPHLLEMRAQLRLDAGDLDGAARDGILLVSRHERPAGEGIAFAATVGRLWSATALDRLDSAARQDPVARMARMEHALVTAARDPFADARVLDEEPRARLVADTIRRPSEAGSALQGWPEDLPRPKARAPRGFVVNARLGAVPGVSAWSNPLEELAVVRVGGITGLLPPPLGLLYTPSPAPVRSLPGGGQVLRLEGGVLPLYAAVTLDGGEEVYGLGYTPDRAVRALELGTR